MAKRIVLSDGNKVNSKGYRIDLSGMNTDRFADNPVMLYQHNQDKVIGRWENWNFTENKLQADPVFDDGDELGAEVKRKYEGDFLRAASIGLIVLDMQLINDVWTVTKSELLEASIVSIPADAGAVVLYNENKEVLTFEQLQLNFNNNHQQIQNQSKMQQITLSQKTVESLALPNDYTPKDVELAVAEKDKTIATLNAQIAAAGTKERTDYLNQAEKDGKITAAEKTEFLKLADNGGFDSVKAIVDSRPANASASLADQVTKSDLSAGRESWTYKDWSKNDPKGLLKLKHENPAQFEKLQQSLKS
jgi:Caudovirus prohead protease.